MPVRNVSHLVEQALRSLLRQTLTDFEVIVVDDGSTDGTKEIVSGLANEDSRIHLINGLGRGVTEALGQAAAVARGELFARMDGDDECCSDRLLRQVEYLDREPTVAVVGSAVELVSPEGRPVAIHRFPCDPVEVRSEMEGANCVAHPTVVMRRSVYERVGGYRPAFRTAQDYDLWLRILERWEIANLAIPLLRYRVHPKQIGIACVEQQTCDALAAQVARRLRRNTGNDDAVSSAVIDRPLLYRMGVSRWLVGRHLCRRVVAQVSFLRRAGSPEDASALAAALLRRWWRLFLPPGELAALAFIFGGCQRDLGRTGAAIPWLIIALLLRPRLVLKAARRAGH